MIDENKSMLNSAGFPSTSSRDDLESGTWDLSNSKLRPMFENKLRSGKKHFSSLVWQLDYIFSAGAVFLRRNSAARTWALVYLVCLHLWVLYILKSHSPVSEESRSGAIFSLENINNTGGIWPYYCLLSRVALFLTFLFGCICYYFVYPQFFVRPL